MSRLFVSAAVAVLVVAATPVVAKPAKTSEAGMKALTGEMSIPDIEAAMQRGELTSEGLTQAAIDRIHAVDGKLHAVIAVNPDALTQARAADAARKGGKALGPMMGIPVLIKDNVETNDPMATTAGSLALKDNITHRDSPAVAHLRAGGAVILGKTNLSEWANIRSTRAMSGWSGVGGLVANPYDLTRTACGSSSGTGAGIAADLVVVGIGTETDGSGHLSVGDERPGRSQADGRPGVAHPYRADQPQPGHGRAHGPFGHRYRHPADRHGRQRPDRRGDERRRRA